MQSKTPLLMVTALVCGLGAAFGTWKLVSGAQAAPAQDENKVKVLVPVAEIQPYCLFQDEKKFTTIEWPKHKLREVDDTITSFDQIKGKQSRHYKLRPNEPLYKNDLCENSDIDIASRLKAGEVAAAIRTDPTSSSGGFIQVGDHVNVAATIPGAGQGDKPESLYILNNVEVLAVDNIAQRGQTGDALPTNRMVLRVSFEQALVLKNFSDGGKLDVYKRKIDDPTNVLDLRYSQGKGKALAKTTDEETAPVATPVPVENKPVEVASSEVKSEPVVKETPKGPEYDVSTLNMRLDDGTSVKNREYPDVKFKKLKTEGAKENEKDKDANAAAKENGEKKVEGKNKEPGK